MVRLGKTKETIEIFRRIWGDFRTIFQKETLIFILSLTFRQPIDVATVSNSGIERCNRRGIWDVRSPKDGSYVHMVENRSTVVDKLTGPSLT